MIIDAKDAVLGRVATRAAKEALNGQQVDIINAEAAILSGDPKMIFADYREKREMGTRYKGPFHARRPDLFVRRSVRGMLPYDRARGQAAYKKIKAHLGIPKEFEGKETVKIESNISNLGTLKYIKVGKLCSLLGWNDAS